MNTKPTLESKEASVCDCCPRAFECGKLTMALTVLESDRCVGRSADGVATEFYETLAATGYNFPDSQRACSLVHCPEPVRKLTEWAIGIMKSRRLRPQAPKAGI